MKRRKFVKSASVAAVGITVLPLASCVNDKNKGDIVTTDNSASVVSEFNLPDLGFDVAALEPNIDTETMTIHHGKHHAGYVKKLNKALSNHSLLGKDLNEILASVSEDKEDIGVRNNGGGHYNHSLFWEVMQPGGASSPSGALLDALNASFESFDKFKDTFAEAGAKRFGSGWAWLVKGEDGKLFVSSTPNQDNPVMKNIVQETGTPILGIDVWEHAYYLNYQNRRKEYINNFFNVINWNKVAQNFAS